MKYRSLINRYRKKGIRLISYGKVREGEKSYRLYKFKVNNRARRTLIITTGFHGEEYNGPISLLEIIDEIIWYSKHKSINLVVYPCINPSGFDLRERYNASNETASNDFIRYEIKKGFYIGILFPNQDYLDYKIIDSKAKEVRALKKDILKIRRPEGLIDIHQDDDLAKGDCYAYIFDNKPIYKKIMKKVAKIAKIAKNIQALTLEDNLEIQYQIDKDGFIFLHDGTLTDLYYRLGTKYSVTVETNTDTPLRKVAKINKIWIKEIIDLAAAERIRRRK